MLFFQQRKQRKRLQALIHHARGLRHMREDVLAVADLAELDAGILAAEQASRGHDEKSMTDVDLALSACIEKLTPPCSLPEWRENFEVLVVALGVAMAFRAYFYQPFQIPTGSMQPTLYGISSHEQVEPRSFDKPIFKIPNWLVTGEWFQHIATQRAGKIAVLWGDDRVPGCTTVVSGHWYGTLPPNEILQKDSVVIRTVYAIGKRLGVLDRGYDLHFLPNDVTSRHAGIFGADFTPALPVQLQIVETLRKDALLLNAAALEISTSETRATVLQTLRPLLATIAYWSSRGGQLDAAALQAVLQGAELCEIRRQGRMLAPALEQQICRALGNTLSQWASDASARATTVPWFPLVSGCGMELPAGQRIWSGVVTSGDFLFVNRWVWNFRLPRRGEVMVFSTKDIATLPQGTHYIKRMCGLPGETLSIHPPEFWINGKPMTEPHAIGRVARKEQLGPWAPPYAGYGVVGEVPSIFVHALRTSDDSIQLASDEYFAMGDNTRNSQDGRYWGAVPRRNLLGPAAVVYWPFTSHRWGLIE